MSKIKTRESIKDIRALDKAATAAERMKDAFVRTKDSAERTGTQEHDSPNDYAIEKIKDTAEDAGREAVDQAGDMGGRAFQKARDIHRSHKEAKQAADGVKDTADNVRESARGVKNTADGARRTAGGVKDTARETARGTERAAKGAHKSATGVRDSAKTVRDTSRSTKTAVDLPKELMKKRAQDAARHSGAHVRQAANNTIKTVNQVEKGVKSTAKGSVKTVQKSIKTAEQTAKTTVKTTQQAAKATRKTAQATVKATRAAAQAARATAKATVAAVKAAVKAVMAFVKAAIAATKALVSAIAAGGGVVVVVILIICMVALLVCSVFGIFSSSENGVSENGMTMKSVVSQINTEFSDELARIINDNPHDDYDITSDRAEWKEVLAVYAVKTNTDPDNPLDVITLDDEKVELLRTVFWDMNIIDYWIEEIEHTSTTTNEDGSTETDTWYEYILHITVTSKTASEMAEQYGFNDKQKAQLEELLRPEYDELWRAVLYGSLSGSTDIVEVAISQIGNVGGEPYWSWYGFDSRVEWCACFVSWCANECGYIEAGVIPRFAGCQSQGIPWFKAVDLWQDSGSGYIPNPGDIIFFDWEGDGESDHVGIVEYVEDGIVHTVEGNSSDSCRRRSYSINSSVIVGYGTPAY